VDKQKNGNTVEIWECNGLENQLWYFTAGSYEIQYGGDSSKCLDAGSGKGKPLMIWDCNHQAQQKWGYDPNENTVYLASSQADASSCMDLAGGSVTHGTPVQLWDCSASWNQQWHIQPGITIRIGQDSNLCLDAAGGSTKDGTAIQLWNCNGMSNQFWIFASGTNQIRSAADMSKCLDAGSMKPGSDVMLWDCNGQSQQKWGYDSKMGTIYLAESAMDASICVDIPGGSLNPGNKLQVWNCNGCWNQDMQIYGPPSSSNANDMLTASASGSDFRAPTRMQSTGSCPQRPGPGPQPPSPSPPPPSPSPSPSPASINSWCNNNQVQGWPTFKNQGELSGDSKWSKYFTTVYGSVPTSGYPICVGGMYFAYQGAMQQAGISTSTLRTVHQEFGSPIYTIHHGGAKAFASNTWVEGLHCRTGAEYHSAWYWYYPGSGIYIWSGKTDVFQHRTQSWQKYLGTTHCQGFECGGKLFTTAKSKFGIDTVQYTSETDGNTFMWIVCMGVGRNTCGAAQCQWKAGWAASRSCGCNQNSRCQNCQGVGQARLGDGNSTSASPCFV